MDEQQTTNQYKEHMHITHAGWMYVALVVIAFAAVIGTGFGVYYLQQGQVESLERALSDKSGMKVATSKEITSATATTPFSEQQIPYTFSYPTDWVREYDAPIHTGPTTPQAKYVISFKAPGTFIATEPIGVKSVKAGALITVRAETSKVNTPDEWIKSLNPTMKVSDRKDVTIAGVAAAEFRASYEGQEMFYTVFVKDAKAYVVSFVAGDGLQTSKYFSAYKDLVASLKFK